MVRGEAQPSCCPFRAPDSFDSPLVSPCAAEIHPVRTHLQGAGYFCRIFGGSLRTTCFSKGLGAAQICVPAWSSPTLLASRGLNQHIFYSLDGGSAAIIWRGYCSGCGLIGRRGALLAGFYWALALPADRMVATDWHALFILVF